MTTDAAELSSFFDQTDLDPETYERYADAAHASFHAYERFDTLVREYSQRVGQGGGDALRLALGWLVLGRLGPALERFQQAPASKERHYYAAQAALGLGRLNEALEQFRKAGEHGWDPLEIALRCALVQIRAGDHAAAEKLVRQHEDDGQDRPDWHLAEGLLLEAQGDRPAALDAFEKALTLDPEHAETMFAAARLYDLSGEDAKALELYRRLTMQPRAYANALINAAVIWEDLGQYDEAAACLRRVLRAHPNHTRARLFLKDVESCQEMLIDETREERSDARVRLLDTPLSEFELSVRARNCLKKMNIRTLGELIRLTEAELLAYKNFGETSLNEIKTLLAKKSLRLGMSLEQIDVEALTEGVVGPKVPGLPPGQEAVLAKPVSELELSVRARRCLQRLNVQTLGDLIQYTESDLLATRNFGVTSLNEIKTRLSEHGLQLAPKRVS